MGSRGPITPLGELRWHWSDAYIIDCYGLGHWVAQRRDDRTVVRAGSPEELHDLIVEDYLRPAGSAVTAQEHMQGKAAPNYTGARPGPEQATTFGLGRSGRRSASPGLQVSRI